MSDPADQTTTDSDAAANDSIGLLTPPDSPSGRMTLEEVKAANPDFDYWVNTEAQPADPPGLTAAFSIKLSKDKPAPTPTPAPQSEPAPISSSQNTQGTPRLSPPSPRNDSSDSETQRETDAHWNDVFNNPAALRDLNALPPVAQASALNGDAPGFTASLANYSYLSSQLPYPTTLADLPALQQGYTQSRNLPPMTDQQLFDHIGQELQDKQQAEAALQEFRGTAIDAKFNEMAGIEPPQPEPLIQDFIDAHPEIAKSPNRAEIVNSMAKAYDEESRWMDKHGSTIKALHDDLRDVDQLQSDPVTRNAYVTQISQWPAADQQKALDLWVARAERDPDEKSYLTKVLSQMVRRTGGVVEASIRTTKELLLEHEADRLKSQPQTAATVRRLGEIHQELSQISLDRNIEYTYNNIVNPNRSNASGLKGDLANAGLGLAGDVPPLLLSALRGVGLPLTATALSLEQKEKLKQKYPGMSTYSALSWGSIEGTLHALFYSAKLGGMAGKFGKAQSALGDLGKLPLMKRLAGKVGLNALVIQGATEADLLIDPAVEWIASHFEPSMKDFDAAKEFGKVFNLDTQLQTLLSSGILGGLGLAGHGFATLAKSLIRYVRETLLSGDAARHLAPLDMIPKPTGGVDVPPAVERPEHDRSTPSQNKPSEASSEKTPPIPIKIEKPADWSKLFIGSGAVIRKGESVKAVLGRELTDEELSNLAGATSDATVTVTGSTFGAPTLTFKVESPHVREQLRALQLNEKGELVLENLLLEGSENNMRGFGAHTLAMQVKSARLLGVSHIETFAYRNSRDGHWVGYYVWGRLGFDSKLSSEEIQDLPKWLSRSKMLSDIMSTEKGRLWWRENGYPKNLVFNLQNGSKSMKVLEEYLITNQYNIGIYDKNR